VNTSNDKQGLSEKSGSPCFFFHFLTCTTPALPKDTGTVWRAVPGNAYRPDLFRECGVSIVLLRELASRLSRALGGALYAGSWINLLIFLSFLSFLRISPALAVAPPGAGASVAVKCFDLSCPIPPFRSAHVPGNNPTTKTIKGAIASAGRKLPTRIFLISSRPLQPTPISSTPPVAVISFIMTGVITLCS
jgi:hypothetical protein